MASNDIVVATLMLDFREDGGSSSDANGHLSLEQLENKDYVLWQGGIELLEHQVVGGSKSGGGTYTEAVEEYVVFSNSETASLPKPASGGVSWSRVGNAYTISESGVVSQTNPGTPSLDQDKVTARLGSKVVALYKAEYTAEGQKFTIQTSLPVVVVFAVGRVL